MTTITNAAVGCLSAHGGVIAFGGINSPVSPFPRSCGHTACTVASRWLAHDCRLPVRGRTNSEWGAYRVRRREAPLCPFCRVLCSGYDTRSRQVVGGDGKVTVFRLRRVRCPQCKALHLELPGFMRPHKHYSAAVISDALEGSGADCPAEKSTIWRWRQENHPPALQCPPAGAVVQSTYSDTKGENP